jgi:predicted DNA-binding protein with PD1-like motif
MRHIKTEKGFIITLARGEELITALTQWCADNGVMNAVFQGIGSVERVHIGYYDLGKKEYVFRSDDGVFEVASMQGNVALVEGKPFIHAHAVLSRCDESLACIGAHIKEAHVAVTLEIFMTALDSDVSRVLDEDIGLKLLHI